VILRDGIVGELTGSQSLCVGASQRRIARRHSDAGTPYFSSILGTATCRMVLDASFPMTATTV
jgi:hypothetical protein